MVTYYKTLPHKVNFQNLIDAVNNHGEMMIAKNNCGNWFILSKRKLTNGDEAYDGTYLALTRDGTELKNLFVTSEILPSEISTLITEKFGCRVISNNDLGYWTPAS